MRTRLSTVWLGGAAVALALTLTGCGTETAADTQGKDPVAVSSDTPTPEVTAPDSTPDGSVPACDEVWQVGADLPMKYAGCRDQDDVVVKPDVVNCSVGNTMVLFDKKFYATPGHIIRAATPDYENDATYQQVYMVCTG